MKKKLTERGWTISAYQTNDTGYWSEYDGESMAYGEGVAWTEDEAEMEMVGLDHPCNMLELLNPQGEIAWGISYVLEAIEKYPEIPKSDILEEFSHSSIEVF